MTSLFDSLQAGALTLPNRVVLAPLTRSRADNERVPTQLMADYYARRAGFGLIVTEATSVDPLGVGYPRTPGLWSKPQVAGWARITDAVHAAGGRIVAQLWHVGRISDPIYLGGRQPLAPSPLPPGEGAGHISLVRPQRFYGVPRAMEESDIRRAIESFAQAARNAQDAGFDGVEIHGANGYLLDQFLQSGSNHRTDAWGGTLQRRARLPLEIVDAVAEVWGPQRVGYHLAPRADILGMGDEDPESTFSYLVDELSARRLAFVISRDPEGPGTLAPVLRPRFSGAWIANGSFTPETAAAALREGKADAVAFGQLSIPNPDLPERLRLALPLATPQPATFYNEHRFLFDGVRLPPEGFHPSDRLGYLEFNPAETDA